MHEALPDRFELQPGSVAGQNVMVDHALGKAGSLQFLHRQAEGTIENLREEREVTTVSVWTIGARVDEDTDDDSACPAKAG